jgi:hypothetical protein
LADSIKFESITNELVALARSRHPDKNSWQSVKQVILQAATHLRRKAGQVSAPISLEDIENLRYIQKKVD